MVWTYPWPSMTSILRRFQVLGRFVGHLIRVLSSEQKKKLQIYIAFSIFGVFFFFMGLDTCRFVLGIGD
mgnify:CR=1 FL=1